MIKAIAILVLAFSATVAYAGEVEQKAPNYVISPNLKEYQAVKRITEITPKLRNMYKQAMQKSTKRLMAKENLFSSYTVAA